MFNMGFTELIALAGIALIFIGPKQLPEVARTIARLLNEFKRATSGVTETFDQVKHESESLLGQGTSAEKGPDHELDSSHNHEDSEDKGESKQSPDHASLSEHKEEGD